MTSDYDMLNSYNLSNAHKLIYFLSLDVSSFSFQLLFFRIKEIVPLYDNFVPGFSNKIKLISV